MPPPRPPAAARGEFARLAGVVEELKREERALANGTEEEILAAFVDVLARETRALIDGRPEAIEAIAREKHACLAPMARLTADEDCPAALRDLRDEARRLNENNGRLVAMRLVHVHERLALLTGRSDAGAAYDSGGFSAAGGLAPEARYRLG